MREATVERVTKETNIRVRINLDGTGKSEIDTGIGFFDHMLELMALHGSLDLEVKARGDLNVDTHHTVEDVGLCIGQAILKGLGNKKNINRYGSACVPMDEALAEVVLDISNRPYLVYNAPKLQERLGTMDSELVPEFLKALTQKGGITLHATIRYGTNSHHMVEALFKALGRALHFATRIGSIYSDIPSSKGSI